MPTANDLTQHATLLPRVRENDAFVTASATPTLQSMDGDSISDILDLVEAPIIACTSDGLIRDANAAACVLFGYESSALAGQPLDVLLPPDLRWHHSRLLTEFVASGERIRTMANRREVVGYRRDGSSIPLEIAIARFDTADGDLLMATLRDISARKQIEKQLRWQAEHDPLTALPNRQLVRDRLNVALTQRFRVGCLGVLLVDLDDFRLINHTYGNEFGDRVLALVAQRLFDVVAPGDMVGRLSGDEFVVLSEDLLTDEDAVLRAKRIIEAMGNEFTIDGVPLHLSASVGIAVDSANNDADDLLRAADTAMQDAKQSAPGSWQLFSPKLSERTRQRMSISQGLHGAIARGEFSIQVQPIVHLETSDIVAAELLLRWTPPTGCVPPGLFVPIAEATGMIVEIGSWVFARACEIEAAWRRRWGSAAPTYLAINLSARQLGTPNLVSDFSAMIAESGADPERLLLEVTETSLMMDVDANLVVLHRLAALGMHIAIDDFGTGYSSLSQLTKMPVSVLKVDRTFVAGINQGENRAVVSAIAGLSRALGLTMVAEGVETPPQLQQMLLQGCSLGQGYLFHRPMGLDAFDQAMDRQLTGRRVEGESVTRIPSLPGASANVFSGSTESDISTG